VARVHPSDIERLRADAPHRAELHTLEQLRHHLSDEYTIYHSLHFAYQEGRRQRFGEIDFVVVNRSGHLLLIEQKNGDLIEGEDTLRKQYPDGRKDVVAQILRGRGRVVEQLDALVPDASRHPVHVLLYCPDHVLRSAGTAGLPRAMILDASERSGLEAWIERTLGPGGESGAETAKRVRAWACRALEVEPDLGASIERQEQTYTRMAGGLVELVDGLELSPWRLRVQASAGSGKSLAAQHAFRKAQAEGRRPLLLCFNSVLAATLQDSLGERRDAGTFHNWCRRMLEENGRAFEHESAHDPGYWKRMVQEVIDCDPPEPRYDTFIIDEAQDFDPDWWALLECFGADEPDARILCFEDAHQDLYGRPGVPLGGGGAVYRSRAVFRTPQRIARFIDRLLEPDVDWRSPYRGLPVQVHTYTEEEEQLELISKCIDTFIEEGFAPAQILVLSMHGRARACFTGREAIGGHRLRKFTGGFTADGQPMFTAGQLEAETLYRFKGNQKPAVLVTDFDLDRSDEAGEWRKIYCALTRATVACRIIAAAQSSWLARLETATA